MSTTTSITTTYSGEFAGQYVAASLLEANTLAKGGVTVKPNVKFKEVLKKVSLDDVIKDATCDFDPTSTITLTERILQPTEQQVNLQVCKQDFRSDWEATQMGFSAYDSLPPSFSDFILGHVAAKVAEKTEQNIWRGVATNAGEFDGFTQLVSTDAALPAAQEIAGTTVDSSNVIAQLGSIVDAIPSSLYGNEDLHIYVSQNIYRAYIRALGGFGADGLGAAGFENRGTNQALQPVYFDGVKLFVANGLADNDAIATPKSNLFFGTGLLSDHNEVKLLDMADLDGSQNARIIMRFTAGVQIANIEDVVTYGIANSAN